MNADKIAYDRSGSWIKFLGALFFSAILMVVPFSVDSAEVGSSLSEEPSLDELLPSEPGPASVREDKTLQLGTRAEPDPASPPEEPLNSVGESGPTLTGMRQVPVKPAHTKLTPHVRSELIVVKFVEGSGIRLRNGKPAAAATQTPMDLTALDAFNAAVPGGRWKRGFSRPEAELTLDKTRGEARSGRQLADLNLYFHFELPANTPDPEAVIDMLNAMPIVEIAYFLPIPEPAQVREEPGPVQDVAPPTPNFTNEQGYLNAAPTGIDARYSWQFDGGAGEGIDIIDIEQGWDVCHEDLDVSAASVIAGTNTFSDHGTAVLGEIIGFNNNYGVTGIAHQARARMVSYPVIDVYPDVHNSINTAAANLIAGDIILIEIHAYAVDSGLDCHCNCGQFEYVAMEYFQANFDAIQTATANGIIVVQAAGNGSMNLDSAIYGSRFNRSFRDSGAILVGAATSAVPHEGKCWTNYGSRVDVYAWGENVVTTGYGDRFNNPGDDCQDYTRTFSGTSSASPIIVGAAADIQGILLARGEPLLTPLEMRAILANNGTPHGTNPEDPPRGIPIGVMPDLRRAIPAAIGDNGHILVFRPYTGEAERIRALGYRVTTTTTLSHLLRSNLKKYDVLWIGLNVPPADYSAYNAEIRNWVYYDGGGLVVTQPNTTGAVSVFPSGYNVSITDIYWPGGTTAQIANGNHPITRGLANADLSGNFDTVPDTGIGYRWWVLARSVETPSAVALLSSYYGSGRFLFHTGHIGAASGDPGSDTYVRRVIDWSANLGAKIALVGTTGISNSVIKALNDLDRRFVYFDTANFSALDFSPYDAVIVAMDGGSISAASIQNAANYANSGGNLIMLGGSSLAEFATAVDTYLLDIDAATYGWKTVTTTPHLDVVNSNHPLTDGLPDTRSFVNSSATYYMIRSQDALARILARNGDNQPALIQKPIGSGTLNWFINSPYTDYWSDAGDYGILKTIIRNMLSNGVMRIYHSPASLPRGLGWTGYPNLFNCDDNDSIYKIESYSGALLDTYPMPGGGLGLGLAFDGANLWHSDFQTGVIYKLNPYNMAVISSFPSPRPYPADLAYGGGHLWAAILQNGPIIKINLSTGQEVGSVNVPTGSRPFGLTWADGYLYVSDDNKDLIYKINPNTGSIVSTFPSPGSYPSGLTFDGNYFWVADWTDHALYQVSFQAQAADVAVTNISFSPTNPIAGQNITASVAVTNYGPVATPGFYVEFYPSINHAPDVYELAPNWWWTSLTAGETKTLTTTIKYNAPGTYQTGGYADSSNTVDEGIYGDNNAYWPVNLTVAACPTPPVISDIVFNGCISELCTSPLQAVATDPCGGILSYSWTALDGGAIVGTGANVTFDPPNSGPHPCPYRIKLAVTSSASGQTVQAIVGVHVKRAGDVDGNGVVNVMDKAVVRNHFGETPASPNWDPRADVDCDGTVGVKDKAIVRNNFGLTGCSCAPAPCFGQSCGNYTKDCDPDAPCICFQTTEGYGNCADDFYCSSVTPCNSSADCSSGQLCYTQTCCGGNVCGPAYCTDGFFPEAGYGPTAGGY